MRFYEALPGILTWTTLIGMVFFSWFLPFWVAIFIIVFDVYWLVKVIYLSFHLRSGFAIMKEKMKTDWLAKLKSQSSDSPVSAWPDIRHLVLLPFYEEPYEVVKGSIDSLLSANYPADKIIVVLGAEERAGAKALDIAERVKSEYQEKFYSFTVTVHPKDLPGEIPGKGSNETWMAKKVKSEVIDKNNIPYEHILVSVFDIDTQIHPEYFGILTYSFLTSPDPLHASYQPIPLFINNIFDTPAMARVVSFSATFWQMMQQVRIERLTTFSSHAIPFKSLVDVGFWHKDIVSEDSRIFWQCLLHYHGNWRVVPLYCPVYMDAASAPGFWQTMINLYRQQRRWAWGVENVPYLLKGFARSPQIPARLKWFWRFNVVEGYHSWATNALMIFALGWLPVLIGRGDFSYSVLSYSLPEITRFIITLSMVGIISSAILAMVLLPPRPKWFKWRHYGLYLLQWILMPFTLIIFGALPAIEAQTRLLLGGRFRLGFWVTPKYRQNDNRK